MVPIDVKELISTGVHFGHRTSRWNPKMAPYILKKRNLIHIIDLRETVRGLITARRLTRAVAAQGEYVLFVGTKRQAREIVRAEAGRCEAPCVAERWPGGLLTNYATIRRRLDRLVELEDLEKSGRIQLYSKKMVSSLRRERRKIERNLGGVRLMNRLPGLLVIVDPRREHLATREGRKLGIPVIGWADTDSDPRSIDVVVPANDDAIGAIQVFFRTIADAVLAGRQDAEGPVAPGPSVEPAAQTGGEPEATAEATVEGTPEATVEGSEGESAQEAPVEATPVAKESAPGDSAVQQ